MLLTYAEVSKLFKLEGYTPEEALLKAIFGYEFNDIIKYETYDENEFIVFWVKKEPVCSDCDGNCENCEQCEDSVNN